MRLLKKRFDSKYVYAGLTAFCVLIAVLICAFLFYNLDGVLTVLGKINSALMPVYIGLAVAYLLSPLVNVVERNVFIP